VNEKKIEIFINHQLIKIKFTLDKIWTGNNWPKRRYKNDLDDRETIRADQGGSVILDDETRHEIERPETHDYVKTECKK
jgi:hypothetical protein